jgi:hypothetical protein
MTSLIVVDFSSHLIKGVGIRPSRPMREEENLNNVLVVIFRIINQTKRLYLQKLLGIPILPPVLPPSPILASRLCQVHFILLRGQ